MDQLLHKNILCIDLKSFYASCECLMRGLDPFTTPLVVADKSRGKGSIVLAVSPFLKQKGVPSRCRIYEIPDNIPIIFAKPRMRLYLEIAAEVVGIYLDYVSEEDMHIYSIDEAFLDVTSYLRLYQKTDYELAKDILRDIESKIGIYATCGIGPNMLISKLALDIESKKRSDFIAKWSYDDIKEKLWPLYPLSEMWGIGPRMERNLNRMGIYKVGDLANYSKDKLKKRFGIMGEELYYHANGIDYSQISQKYEMRQDAKSYGRGQTLFRDYNEEEIIVVIREMVDEVVQRLRINKKKCNVVAFGIGYSKEFGGGFHRQKKLDIPSSDEDIIYQTCMSLFYAYYETLPIRRVRVSVTNLEEAGSYQLHLFEDYEKQVINQNIGNTLDEIKGRFGKNSIVRGTALKKESNIIKRNTLIGGHNA